MHTNMRSDISKSIGGGDHTCTSTDAHKDAVRFTYTVPVYSDVSSVPAHIRATASMYAQLSTPAGAVAHAVGLQVDSVHPSCLVACKLASQHANKLD